MEIRFSISKSFVFAATALSFVALSCACMVLGLKSAGLRRAVDVQQSRIADMERSRAPEPERTYVPLSDGVRCMVFMDR